jgi:predicted dehydrogenase
MQYLTGSAPVSVVAESVAAERHDVVNHDSVFITLRFADGSNGAIAYLSEGDKVLAKERVEIFGEGKTFVIDDFLQATGYRNGREEKTALRAQDKGQAEEVKQLCAMVLSGGTPLIPLAELAATTRATFRILDSLRTGERLQVKSEDL